MTCPLCVSLQVTSYVSIYSNPYLFSYYLSTGGVSEVCAPRAHHRLPDPSPAVEQDYELL